MYPNSICISVEQAKHLRKELGISDKTSLNGSLLYGMRVHVIDDHGNMTLDDPSQNKVKVFMASNPPSEQHPFKQQFLRTKYLRQWEK